MNYMLLLKGILAALDLAIRIAESRGYDPAELEQYINQRNELRQALVERARELGHQHPPGGDQAQAFGDEVPDDGPEETPDDQSAAPDALDGPNTPQVDTPGNADAASTNPNQE